MTAEEMFWRKIRFVLLCVFAISLLFIVFTKLLFPVPMVQSMDLLNSIKESEKVLAQQIAYVPKVKTIKQNIDSLDFAIYQVQKKDEIREKILSLQDIYKKNNMGSKYVFGLQSSKILKIYFDTKEELSSIERNNAIIQKDLDECKANL